MKKIYAVTAGYYSEYRVISLFSSPELAREFMASVPCDDYNELEEFDLDPNTVDLIRRGYSTWEVHMLRDGNTENVWRSDSNLSCIESMGHGIWRRSNAPAYAGKGIPDVLTSKVWAKDETHAIKIVNEHRIQMISSGEW